MQHKKQKNKRKGFVPKFHKTLLSIVFCCPFASLRQGRRGLGLASPQRFFRSFLTPKKNIIFILLRCQGAVFLPPHQSKHFVIFSQLFVFALTHLRLCLLLLQVSFEFLQEGLQNVQNLV